MWIFITGIDLLLGDYYTVSQGNDRRLYSVFFIRISICLIFYFLLVLWCYRKDLLPKLIVCVIFSILLGVNFTFESDLVLWLNKIELV